MLGRTGISKTGIMIKRTIGLDGLVLLAVLLLCSFQRAFPLVCWCHLSPNQCDLRLDWVAKDNTSYSYPVSLYSTCDLLCCGRTKLILSDSSSYDPFNSNAGNGRDASGNPLTPPPDPNTAYTSWNQAMAKTWLSGLTHKPTFVTVDNEIEIASSTHADMHPE
jgi:hypothetical protein